MILNDLYAAIKKRVDALDARLLIGHALTLSAESFLLHKDRVLSPAEIDAVEALVAQRQTGRPVAKILGRREFYGRDFLTTDDTLDPRPDSETLIELVLENADRTKNLRLLDLGTGTGCLVLTLLAEMKNASAAAVDISDAALDVAKQNARRIGVEDRVIFIRSDWFGDVVGTFDLILSNPPYIPSADISGLSRDVRLFDPMGALDGGTDGLDAYRAILAGVGPHLVPSGGIVFEVGQGQDADVAHMLENSGFSRVSVRPDLAGINRIVAGFRL